MNTIILDIVSDFAKGVDFNSAAQPVAEAAGNVISFVNPTILIAAVILIAVTIFLLFFLKKIITNSILGGILWLISTFIFHAELPLIPSFVVSVIFGPAGLGALIILKFFGLI
ncbi:MAG: hypothetical protein WCW44_00250 [archaeon]|jgi:hypothetical protein